MIQDVAGAENTGWKSLNLAMASGLMTFSSCRPFLQLPSPLSSEALGLNRHPAIPHPAWTCRAFMARPASKTGGGREEARG